MLCTANGIVCVSHMQASGKQSVDNGSLCGQIGIPESMLPVPARQ